MQSASLSDARALARHRLLWRWHFYAGLFVMPLLLVLAITGTLYCFQPQIEPLLYHDRMIVDARAEPRLSQQVLLAKATAAEPRDATPTTAVINNDPRRSAEFVFRLQSGGSESVYLNPYTGAVLGRLSVEHRLMKQIRNLHRGLLLGKTGEIVMELAGCWTLVMIGTGVALWWPNAQRSGGRFVPRLSSAKGRAWWRELHAVGGVWLALGALFFVLSGLPWSSTWGKQFKSLATSAQLGYPPGAWGSAHVHSANARTAMKMDDPSMADMKMDDLPLPQTPWAVGETHVPHSAATSRPHDPARSGHRARSASGSEGRLRHCVADDCARRVHRLVLSRRSSSRTHAAYRPDTAAGFSRTSVTAITDAWRSGFRTARRCTWDAISAWRTRSLARRSRSGSPRCRSSGFVMWRRRKPGRAVGAPARPALHPPMRAWIERSDGAWHRLPADGFDDADRVGIGPSSLFSSRESTPARDDR